MLFYFDVRPFMVFIMFMIRPFISFITFLKIPRDFMNRFI